MNLKKPMKKIKREKLRMNKENWAAQGVALFSDILRKNNTNLEELSYEVISNMVKYTNSNQGGIFILNDNDKNNCILEMTHAMHSIVRNSLKKELKLERAWLADVTRKRKKYF